MNTTTDAPAPAPTRKRSSALRFALIAFIVTVIAAGGITAGAAAVYANAFEGRVMPGVSVAGVLLGGLDRGAARHQLLASLPNPARGELTVTVGEQRLVISYAEIGRRYDLEPALDAAMAIGRSGSLLDRSAEQVRALARGTGFEVGVVTYDPGVVDARVAEFVASLEKPTRDATVKLSDGPGVASSWQAHPAQTGVDVDAAAITRAAHAALVGLGTVTAATSVDSAPQILEPVITTEEAETAAAHANALSAGDLVLTHGEERFTIPADTFRGWVSVTENDAGAFDVSMDTRGIEPLLTEMLKDIGTEAQDASFKLAAGGRVAAVPAREGLTVDIPMTVERVNEALQGRASGSAGDSVEVVTSTVEPRFTTAQAQAAAPRVRRVSRWTTYFQVYAGNYYGRNISIPTRTINGTVVAPGRWFDFLKTIGKITRAKGYGQGGAIINGRTETTGALGGGMCSCSTTHFNAALRAGLQMGQRRNHYYYINRYPVGLDATVWETSAGRGLSMRFRNDTEFPVVIRGKYRPGVVTFEIWTVPTGRKVTLTRPVIRDRTSARDTVEYTDNIPVGSVRREEYPTAGFKAWVTRIVRDKDRNVIHEDEFFSHYRAVDGVTLVGVSSSDPRNGTIAYR